MLRKATQPATAASAAESNRAITVIVPTRNEADNVALLLQRLATAAGVLLREVVFVDDSDDATAAVVRAQSGRFPFAVRLLQRPPAQRDGLSGAVVAGLRAARGAWVCVMDADLQHPPEMIPRLWQRAQKTGADLVVGSRKGDVIGPLGLSRSRSLTSKVLTVLARMLFPRLLKNVSDPLTGLFLARRAAVDPEILRPDGFKILLEILVRCPALHVTEVHFDFAPRYGGQSKADFQEGMRFLRHLLTLRVTVNPHLVRFFLLLFSDVAGHMLLLWLLVAGAGVPYLAAAVFATEAVALWHFAWAEAWVFSERGRNGRRRRFVGDLLLTQFGLLLHLPLMYFFVSRGLLGYLPANFIALCFVSLVRYSLSEQWIWTRGSIAWQQQTYHYDLHGIVGIESHVPFVELAHFATAEPPARVDVQIRLDRQGAPTQLPGAIGYDEHMGRFGFSLSVLPGDFTEVVVSPLLQRSPAFLFTNVVEPVLRWSVVRRGYALVKAACVAEGGRATLLVAESDMGQAVVELCGHGRYAFLADDLVVVDEAGRVFSYPKPVTVNARMVAGGKNGRFNLRARWTLAGQRLLYSRLVRRLGLWLSERDLPAATLNTYIQWLVPQPKQRLETVVSGVALADSATLSQVVVASPLADAAREQVVALLQQRQDSAYGFQPYPLLAERLSRWQDQDWRAAEAAIIRAALRRCVLPPLPQPAAEAWWRVLLEPARESLPVTAVAQQGKPRTS